jgi:hypothetical protein
MAKEKVHGHLNIEEFHIKRKNKMFDVNKILGNKKGKSIKFTDMNMSKVFGSNPLSSVIGSVVNKPLKNMGASIPMQNKWAKMSHIQRNVMRSKYKDSDGDRIPNMFDCRPKNIMRQDKQVHLRPGSLGGAFYVSPKDAPDSIFIDDARKLKGETPEDLQLIGNLLGHEEMHHEVYKVSGAKASSGLDSITPVLVENNTDIINKDTAGLPVNPTTAKLYTTQSLHKKIPPHYNYEKKWLQEWIDEDKTDKHYTKVHDRTKRTY